MVARLLAAGAICVGKTNLDQFATGLVGVRSPYGIPRNPFDARFIVGGSSSGSGLAVSAGLASFALGTDTAGSGRVPAAFTNIVGLKPTRGVLSATGVVPACRSLDCVSVFALTVEDAAGVAEVARGFDESDPFARPDANEIRFAPGPRPPRFRFGVPGKDALEFLGDSDAAALYGESVRRLESMGGTATEIDFGPFRRAGALLYDGPFVAERLVTAARILAENPEALVPPVRGIFEAATRIDARAVFEGQHRLLALRRRAAAVLAGVDFLLVPTTPTIFRIDEVEAEPRKLNAQLGAYVNFVNLLDLAALAVPSGFRSNGVPAGVTLIGPAGSDAALAAFGSELHRATSTTLGATGQPFPALPASPDPLPADAISIAVVGAHLSGQPLNHQLTTLGAPVRARHPHRARLPTVCAPQHHAPQARIGAHVDGRRGHRAGGLGPFARRVRNLRGTSPPSPLHRRLGARRRQPRLRLPLRARRARRRRRHHPPRRLARVPAAPRLTGASDPGPLSLALSPQAGRGNRRCIVRPSLRRVVTFRSPRPACGERARERGLCRARWRWRLERLPIR